MRPSLTEVAALIDHAVLHPTADLADVKVGCVIAADFGVASVCVKPYAVDLAVDLLNDSKVAVSTVVGFPHGGSTTRVKCQETQLAMASGAREIDMVINIGEALKGNLDYVGREINEVLQVVRSHDGGLLKVIFETGYFDSDQSKIALCQLCNDLPVDFVKTSTGFAFVKDASKGLISRGASVSDVALMRKYCSPHIGIKASGGIRTLSDVMTMHDLGATRIGTSSTASILSGLTS